ncbi:hypothetical protein ACWD4K_19690 [Streptomyces gelaticus]
MARLASPRGRGARRRIAALAALAVAATGPGAVRSAGAADLPTSIATGWQGYKGAF